VNEFPLWLKLLVTYLLAVCALGIYAELAQSDYWERVAAWAALLPMEAGILAFVWWMWTSGGAWVHTHEGDHEFVPFVPTVDDAGSLRTKC